MTQDDGKMTQEDIDKALRDEIVLFGLSTCMWCKKTKKHLDECKVAYSKIFVDLLDLDQKRQVRDEIKKYNERMSYPTVKIKDKVVVGYDTRKIDEALDS